MTYSEDPSTPAATFTGDGSVFDQPDVLLTAPTTSERVVDTQSGFLLVIRRMGERLALYCKRRVGTPPSSAILLTPDESIKLSKALAASIAGLEDTSSESAPAKLTVPGRRKLPFTAPPVRQPSTAERLRKPAIILAIVGGIVATFYLGWSIAKTAPAQADRGPVKADPLAEPTVDAFARTFAREMLDFNPASYRHSQVQAMAAMSPDLMERYWKETNFPLTEAQLKTLPQDTSVIVDSVDQERTAPDQASAVINAQLVHAHAKMGSPVKLKLKLAIQDETIKVVEQEDLSAAK